MFLGWKIQYNENFYTTQSNLSFNVIPLKQLIAVFTQLEQIIL